MSKYNTFIGLIKAIFQRKLSMLYKREEYGNSIKPRKLRQGFRMFLIFQLLLTRVSRKKLYLVLPDRVKMNLIC